MTWKRNLWIRLAALAFLAAFSVTAAVYTFPKRIMQVELGWDKSPDAQVIGYNIYQGVTPGVYTNKISVGNVTNVVVTPLVPSTTYYFAATAFTSDGLESDLSNEIFYTTPRVVAPPHMKPPKGTNIFVSITGQGEPLAEYAIERSSDLRRFYLHAETQANSQGEFGILELPELLPNPSFYRAYVAK